MRIASQWNTIGEVAARAFIQNEREERCSSTSVCPSVHLLSVCPPFVRQIVQLWVDFVRLSKSGSMGWCKLCATHAWETARMKTSSIDLFDFAKSVPINSFVFTYYIEQSCGRIRNSQTSIFCDSDFPIEHPPFCSHVGTQIQNWVHFDNIQQQKIWNVSRLKIIHTIIKSDPS